MADQHAVYDVGRCKYLAPTGLSLYSSMSSDKIDRNLFSCLLNGFPQLTFLYYSAS